MGGSARLSPHRATTVLLLAAVATAGLTHTVPTRPLVSGLILASAAAFRRDGLATVLAATGSAALVWSLPLPDRAQIGHIVICAWLTLSVLGLRRVHNHAPGPFVAPFFVVVFAGATYACVPETNPLRSVVPGLVVLWLVALGASFARMDLGAAPATLAFAGVAWACVSGGIHRDGAPLIGALASTTLLVTLALAPARVGTARLPVWLGIGLGVLSGVVALLVSRTAGLQVRLETALAMAALPCLAVAGAGVAAVREMHRRLGVKG